MSTEERIKELSAKLRAKHLENVATHTRALSENQ